MPWLPHSSTADVRGHVSPLPVSAPSIEVRGTVRGVESWPPARSAPSVVPALVVSLALDLLAWMPMLALIGKTRRWEPKKLRLRLFSAAAQMVNTGRRRRHRFTTRWPWTDTKSSERSTGSGHCRAPTDSATSTAPMTRTTTPEQWNPAPTRRDTRVSAGPPSATESERVRRLRRRTVKKDEVNRIKKIGIPMQKI